MDRKDWLLLSLAKAPRGTLTPVQAQKAMFLLEQEAAHVVGPDFYKFEPYDYGPFSSLVYSDLEQLAREGKVEITQIPGRRWSVYSITPPGQSVAAKLEGEASQPAAQFVGAVVSWVSTLSFQQLVRAIYDKYPAFKVNSVFRG
jgi:hypothetical protein